MIPDVHRIALDELLDSRIIRDYVESPHQDRLHEGERKYEIWLREDPCHPSMFPMPSGTPTSTEGI